MGLWAQTTGALFRDVSGFPSRGSNPRFNHRFTLTKLYLLAFVQLFFAEPQGKPPLLRSESLFLTLVSPLVLPLPPQKSPKQQGLKASGRFNQKLATGSTAPSVDSAHRQPFCHLRSAAEVIHKDSVCFSKTETNRTEGSPFDQASWESTWKASSSDLAGGLANMVSLTRGVLARGRKTTGHQSPTGIESRNSENE